VSRKLAEDTATAASVRLQRRVIRGCKSPRTRALGSETKGNCVAVRRGGEQLEVNRWSATEVNSIRPVSVASLPKVVKPKPKGSSSRKGASDDETVHG
jgi:hypothetical protein